MIAAVVALAGLVVAGGAWIVGTETGTAWLVQRLLARAAGGGLRVERISGSLLDGLVLENVRLRWPRDELDISRLVLVLDRSAALGGTLAFTRAEAAEVAYRRLTGDAEASEPFRGYEFPVRLDDASMETLSVTVAGRTQVFDAARFAGVLRGQSLTIDSATTSTLGAALSGSGHLDLAEGPALDLEIMWSGPVADVAAEGRATLTGPWPVLRVHHDLAAPFAVVADGTLDFAGTPSADLSITWENLAWPGVDIVASPSGRITLAGTLADYRYDGSGLAQIDGRAAEFELRGIGTPVVLALERLTVRPMRGGEPAGSVVATGELRFEARQAQLALEADAFDPEWIVEGWSGRVNGTTTIDAQLRPSARVRFSGVDARGQLRGYPVAATGSATYTAPDGWAFEPLRLVSDRDTIIVNGSLDRASLALDIDADIEHAEAWLPRVRGQVTGKLAVTGTWRAPRARGRLSARSIAVANVTVDDLDLEGEVGLDAEAPWQLEAEGAGIAVGAIDADRVQARIGGTTSAHRVQVDVTAPEWQASMAASGGLADDGWRGTVEALDFDENLLGRWSLTEPASAAFGAHRINVATSCLAHPSGGRWCAALDLEGSSSDRLVLFAQNFSLETLKPLLPPALTVDGTYQLSASLFDLTGSPHGALALTGGTTRFRVAFGNEQAFATELHDLLVGVTLEDGKLELQADVRSDSEGRASVRASVADVGRPTSPIEGRVTAAWPDLGFLGLLSPELEQVTGAIDVNLGLGGTLEDPKVDGKADWTGGQIAVPAWGVLVEDIEGKITGTDEGVLEFSATGRAGDGQLVLAGTTELDSATSWRTALTLRGNGVRAVQLPDAEIFADPDLDVEVALPELRVMGTLRVPKASIMLDALPEQAVTPSADVVLHGGAASDAYRPLQLRAAVDVELGDDVHYEGLNLDTKVTGSLRMATAPNTSASAAGTLTLAGTYDAYGQLLDLDRGRLIFNGPLDDPGLDVRAVRTIDTTTRVGIELGGTLKSPETRVFSTPSMSEADALSYLLLGQPVTGTGSEETATLQTAAISMGLQQALPVVQRLGTSLKLDELTVRPTATDAGALMAGKYLSPKVYIRYSYGLFNRIGGFLLRFKVNERLSIETRSGEQKSMDLLYTVEKD